MTSLWQDLRYGVRMLWKSPGFTMAVIVALALGIGANTAIFSVVNAVLLRALPYENAGRLLVIYSGGAQDTEVDAPLSYPDFVDYKNEAQTLEHVAAYSKSGTFISAGGDEPERVWGAEVSAELFPLLGVRPALGRFFTAEEDQPGKPSVVVLSHGLWQRRFGSDPRIIGREIKMGLTGRSYTVVGVTPPGFEFPISAEGADYYRPFTVITARNDPSVLSNRGTRFMPVVASLKPDVALEQAAAELDTITNRLAAQYPEVNAGRRTRLVSMHEDLVGDIRPALLVLLGAVGFVLLIACANVANLSLVRASARSKEIAVRTALGASRWRVVRQLLAESLLLSLVSGALGLLLAMWGVDVLKALAPGDIPRLSEVGLDERVLLFTLAVSALTGVVFGLAPAWQASHFDLSVSLKEGGRGSTEGARRNRTRSLLVVSEVALSLLLLVGAGLLLKSFVRLLNADPGYTAARVLTMLIPLPNTNYASPEQQHAFFREAIERTRALPGVEAAAAVNVLPLGNRETRTTFNIGGRPPAAPETQVAARNPIITSDYFRVMNISLRRGRAFTDRDAADAPPVAVINEAFARRYFPNEEPLGQRLILEDENNNPLPPREIVGVVGNVRLGGLDEEEIPEFYVPFFQSSDGQMNLVVRSSTSDPAVLASAVRGVIKGIDKGLAVWETRTMDERVALWIAPRRFNALLLGCFAFVALILAAVGIYGVMAYSVTQRTHEIGLRMALGAQARDVLRLVVGQGMLLTSIGIVVGMAAAFLLTRVMSSLLFGVSATDPLVFVLIPLLLFAVSLVANLIPARRATKVDPMVALRYE